MSMPMIPGDGYGASQNPIANPKKSKKSAGTEPGYGASQHPIGAPALPAPRTPTPSGHGGNPLDATKPSWWNPSTPTTPLVAGQPPVNPSSPGNSGNSGGMGNAGNPTLDKLYADLKASLTQTGVDNNALVDKSIESIKGNYSQSQLDAYKAYMGNRDDVSGRALNLGVDLNESTMGKTWDGNMRRLTEMSDSNLNSDLSYMEKMRQIKAAALEAILAGVEQDKLSRLAAMRSGGGGSSRGGGGSSGSGSASETQTVDNVGDYETYQRLQMENPAAAKIYYDNYWGNEGNTKASVSTILKSKSGVNSTLNKAMSGIQNSGALAPWMAQALKIGAGASNNNHTTAAQAMQGLTGLWGNPKIGQKITYKGKS